VVKVLDFGLAQAREETPLSGDPQNSPTLSIDATHRGVILGTAAYMSSERFEDPQSRQQEGPRAHAGVSVLQSFLK
jgi:hypothetical protein